VPADAATQIHTLATMTMMMMMMMMIMILMIIIITIMTDDDDDGGGGDDNFNPSCVFSFLLYHHQTVS
jgi:hypothetical protein